MAFPWHLLAIAATLAGTAAQIKATSDAASRRKDAINQSLANATAFDDKANQATLQGLEEFKPEVRELRRKGNEEENLKTLVDAIKFERDDKLGGKEGDVKGKVSEAYKNERAKRTEEVLAKAIDLAKRTAAFNAIPQAGYDDRQAFNELRNDLGTVRRDKSGQLGVDQVRISEVSQPDTGLVAAAQILQGIGLASGLAGGASSAGSAGASAGASAGSVGIPKGSTFTFAKNPFPRVPVAF